MLLFVLSPHSLHLVLQVFISLHHRPKRQLRLFIHVPDLSDPIFLLFSLHELAFIIHSLSHCIIILFVSHSVTMSLIMTVNLSVLIDISPLSSSLLPYSTLISFLSTYLRIFDSTLQLQIFFHKL